MLNIIRSASGAFLAQATLHAELAQVEWEEEKQRLFQMVVFTFFAFTCFMCLLIVVSAFAIALSWYTPYRIPVFVGLIFLYASALVWGVLRLKALAALSSNSFSATKAEIAADIELIKSVL
ncbi:MAG: hypothetical protein EOO68_00320 [Moraxellaceae bacterium]|nr:MAG: hypothetical protein EOO68_00320 [Moraxellaceae bacterium]